MFEIILCFCLVMNKYNVISQENIASINHRNIASEITIFDLTNVRYQTVIPEKYVESCQSNGWYIKLLSYVRPNCFVDKFGQQMNVLKQMYHVPTSTTPSVSFAMVKMCKVIFNTPLIQNILLQPQLMYVYPEEVSNHFITMSSIVLPNKKQSGFDTNYYMDLCSYNLPLPNLQFVLENKTWFLELELTTKTSYIELELLLEELSTKLSKDKYQHMEQAVYIRNEMDKLLFLFQDMKLLVHTFETTNGIQERLYNSMYLIREYYETFVMMEKQYANINDLHTFQKRYRRIQEENRMKQNSNELLFDSWTIWIRQYGTVFFSSTFHEFYLFGSSIFLSLKTTIFWIFVGIMTILGFLFSRYYPIVLWKKQTTKSDMEHLLQNELFHVFQEHIFSKLCFEVEDQTNLKKLT